MAVFTDEQINEILSIFRQNLGHRQYIGARYVPIFGRKGETSIEWDNSAPYEPLTIVLHQGNSYTSRQYVPTGIDIDNNDFWAETGNFNAQIEQYRQEVLNFDGRIIALNDEIEDINKYTSKRKTKVLSHRGMSTISNWIYSIDNSIWSYVGAFANGFDGFECDVRMDANGALVMLHDATTDSVSLQTGNIREMDYTQVFYKTKKTNVQTPTHLTSFVEMCQIVKQFDGFAFVEIKDGDIIPSIINAMAQDVGLSYDSYAFFPGENLSSSERLAWFESALDIPYLKVGYYTDDYTATAQEMATLKTIADAHNKAYNEIIVRCNKPQDIVNIKNVGFLSSYDPASTFTSESMGNLSIDFENVDYSISQGQWNGTGDANTNYKGEFYRLFLSEIDQYATLNDLFDSLSNYSNGFFGRIRGNKLVDMLTALNLNIPDSASNGASIMGRTDDTFVTGDISIFRTNESIHFEYEKTATSDTNKLLLRFDGFIRTLTAAKIDAILDFVKANTSSAQTNYGYMAASEANTFFNTTATDGCRCEVITNSVGQTVIGYPVRNDQHKIYVYKRASTSDTPVIYNFEAVN